MMLAVIHFNIPTGEEFFGLKGKEGLSNVTNSERILNLGLLPSLVLSLLTRTQMTMTHKPEVRLRNIVAMRSFHGSWKSVS